MTVSSSAPAVALALTLSVVLVPARALGSGLRAVRSADDAVALLAAHGLHVEPGSWTERELKALAHGLEALPVALRTPPGGPLTLRRVARAADHGMAGWADARRTVFELGELHEPSDDRRAHARLSALTSEERTRLWRQRAVVHAVMQRWDDALGISRRRAWRRINGWEAGSSRAVWSFAYSRRLGEGSASADLVTFAEELWIPAESIRADALPPDDQVRCQELSKSRVLFAALRDAGLVSPHERTRGACPMLDAFVDAGSLEGAELLYVAASGRAPESLFGHLLLRLTRRREGQDGQVRAEGFDTAAQLVALTGSEPQGLSYAARGVFGGFQMSVMTGPLGELWHQVLEHEARTIRRFRLKLTPDQLERLAERVWELERRGYRDYRFFRDNCAALAAFLVEGVLDEEAQLTLPPSPSPVLPSAVLDAFASAGLLEPVALAWDSVRDRAERSAHARGALARRLSGQRLLAAHALLQSPRLEARRAGWHLLSELTRAHANDDEDFFAYWVHTVRIERLAVERARTERLEILAGAALPTRPPPGADETVAERQRLFERERPDERAMAALDRIALNEYLLEHAPRRALTDDERTRLERADALDSAFAELTALHGDLVAEHFTGVDAHRFLHCEEQARRESQATWAQSALRSSGYARRAFGGAVHTNAGTHAGTDDGTRSRGAVALSFAALDESLGDQRLHGFQPHSEMKVLAGTVLFGFPEQGLPLPKVLRSDLTLWSYRTLQREVPVFRESLRDHLGWGFRVGWDVDASRARPGRLLTNVEALGAPSSRRPPSSSSPSRSACTGRRASCRVRSFRSSQGGQRSRCSTARRCDGRAISPTRCDSRRTTGRRSSLGRAGSSMSSARRSRSTCARAVPALGCCCGLRSPPRSFVQLMRPHSSPPTRCS